MVDLSLAAWAPVFASFEQVLGPTIYSFILPDWRTSQTEVVTGICKDTDKTTTWVAEVPDSRARQPGLHAEVPDSRARQPGLHADLT